MSWFRRKSPPSPYPIQGRDSEFIDTVTTIYREELGREPDTEGLASWVNGARYGLTGETIRAAFHNSPEGVAYQNRPPEVPPVPQKNARRGVVYLNDKQFVDADGPFRPFGCTLFWAIQGWKTERDRFKANVLWMRDHGFDFVRILAQVGWSERSINPAELDYEQTLAEVIDYIYDVGTMRVEIVVIGGGFFMPPTEIAAKVINVVATRPQKVIYFQAANESFQNCPEDEVIAVARKLRMMLPNLVSTSDPAPVAGGLDTIKRLNRQASANLFTFHPDRGPGDNDWRAVRQAYDSKDFGGAVSINEPIGPDSSVHELRNPLQLAAHRTLATICGAGSFVFHPGSMVLGTLDPNHPSRVPNIWEVSGIEEMVSATLHATDNLPEGCENWQVANTGWVAPNPVAPFQPDAYWPDSDHGINKGYSAIAPDGRFVQLLTGIKGQVRMTASYPSKAQFLAFNIQRVNDEILFNSVGQVSVLIPGRDDTMSVVLIVGNRL